MAKHQKHHLTHFQRNTRVQQQKKLDSTQKRNAMEMYKKSQRVERQKNVILNANDGLQWRNYGVSGTDYI